MRSPAPPWHLLLATLLFAACPTRTIYYDAGADGARGPGGGAGGPGGGGGHGGGPGGLGGGGGLLTPGGSAGGPPVGGGGGHATTLGCDSGSCPNGCCTATGACVPYASETNNACGTSGAACSACPTGSTCNTAGGICQGCGSPVAVTEASIGIPGAGSDQFGQAVAVRNGMMLVEAPNAAGGVGRVYSFAGSGSSYTYVQFVAPNTGSVSASLQGIAMDRTGATAVVGGSVGGTFTEWLFTRTVANWFAGPSVGPPENPSGRALDSGTLVVGGSLAAYVYSSSGGSPVTLAPSDFMPGNTTGFFTAPVAVSGSTVLVTGEPLDSSGELAHFGYIFVKSGSTWVQQAKLIPSDLLSNNNPHFHFSAALDGATAVLATSVGAYVFSQTGSSWSQVQKIAPPTDTNGFGASVDLSGGTLVISDTSNAGTPGAAYVYGRANGSWILGPTLSTGASDGFGASVAVDRGTVAVGAPSSGDGAVYLFSCPSTP